MSVLVRDGVRLWYEETGSGDPPLVLAHGWCCDHTYFAPQLAHFKDRHRVIAVDLRGHGRSDQPQQDYTIGGFAEDLLWLAQALELEPVVLVGHSMGAIAALEAAARDPDRVAAAVLIDPSPVAVPAGLGDLAAQFIEALHGREYEQAARQHVEQVLFLPTDDAALRAKVADAICATPQHVMASSMEQIFAWDGEAAARACTVPTLVISAAQPIGDIERFRELCRQLVTEQTSRVGHFNQLLAPEQVNSMIERFLATSLTGRALAR